MREQRECKGIMKQVTKEEFYATVGQLNVHPRSERERSVWETLDGTRRVVGVSTPGYMCEGPETYMVVENA